jgi:Sec-independent protein translocase protein TatA
MLGRWMEITFVLIVIFLVLSRATAFSTAARSIGSVYVGAVKALQGR